MQNIALKSLEHSDKFNVRKTNKDKNISELVASIKNHGLLENLLVIKAKKNKFEVVAGGRRLLALNQLQKEGFLKNEYQVPCEVVSKKNAEEISLAENAIREAMHPADQFEAFSKLSQDGKSIADIAACFGVSDTIVEKRLKLGKLSPVLMEAYRNEEISLEILMAYTLTDDHARQEEVYNATKDNYYNSANSVRNMLTETSISATDKIVKFIGLDNYKNAGGTLKHDLFCDNDTTYLDDLELVNKLANEKLQEKAKELSQKWSWCETAISYDYDTFSKYDRYYPTQNPVPDELNLEFEEITEKLNELEDNPEANKHKLGEVSQKYLELAEKVDSYTSFQENEYQTGGCLISIDWHGNFDIREGLIRPEDKKKIQEASTEENSETSNQVISQSAEAPSYSQALIERLKNYRLHPVKIAIADDFETSFDFMLYTMCSRLFKQSNYYYYSNNRLGLTVEEYYYPHQLASDDETCSKFQKAEENLYSKLPLDWLNAENENDKFECFCNLTKEQKQQLFSACTAKILKPQLSDESQKSDIFEVIKERLSVDVSEHWRPNSSNFLERITKSQLVELAEDLISKEWAEKHKSKKKGELVKVMNEAFNGSQNDFTEEQKTKLNSWLPEGM